MTRKHCWALASLFVLTVAAFPAVAQDQVTIVVSLMSPACDEGTDDNGCWTGCPFGAGCEKASPELAHAFPACSKEAEIKEKLTQPLSVQFNETPLTQVIDDLRDLTGINIFLDPLALEEENARLEHPVTMTMKLEHVSLQSALTLMLHQVHLTWLIKDDMLLVTTEARNRNILRTRSFFIQDLLVLLDWAASREPEAQRWDEGPQYLLLKLIKQQIVPDNWSEVGGKGEIDFDSRQLRLIVKQCPDALDEVQELLDALRSLSSTQGTAGLVKFVCSLNRPSPSKPLAEADPLPEDSSVVTRTEFGTLLGNQASPARSTGNRSRAADSLLAPRQSSLDQYAEVFPTIGCCPPQVIPPPACTPQVVPPPLCTPQVVPPPQLTPQCVPPPVCTPQIVPPPQLTPQYVPPPVCTPQVVPPPVCTPQVVPPPQLTPQNVPPPVCTPQVVPPPVCTPQYVPPPVCTPQVVPPPQVTPQCVPPPCASCIRQVAALETTGAAATSQGSCSWKLLHEDRGIRIVGPDVDGTCDRMTLSGMGGRVVLEGHVRLHYHGDSERGEVLADRVVLDLGSGEMHLGPAK